jgi:hypothetical protein
MTASTQLLPFCTVASGSGGNRLTPAAYAALTTILADGFQSGLASSAQINTALAQATLAAAGIANFMVNQNVSQNDDGNAAAFATNFQTALAAYVATVATSNLYAGGTTTGSANVQVLASTSPTATAYTNGQMISCTAGYTNTGGTTFNASSEGAIVVKKDSSTGPVALTGGEIVAGDAIVLTKNTAGSCWVLTSGLPFGSAAFLNTGTGANTECRAVLRNLTAEGGWSVGDEIEITPGRDAATIGVQIGANATQVKWAFGSQVPIIYPYTGSPGTGFNITAANWALVIYAAL